MVVLVVDAIVGLQIHKAIVSNELFEEDVFLGEGTTTSMFFLQHGNQIEVPSYDFKRVKMTLTVPVKKIQEPDFLIREMGAIDIGDPNTRNSASQLEVS